MKYGKIRRDHKEERENICTYIISMWKIQQGVDSLLSKL